MPYVDEHQPSPESYWRAVILFGQNSASYKFALGKALLELAGREVTAITLDDLAVPYATHIAEHLTLADRQGTSGSSLSSTLHESSMPVPLVVTTSYRGLSPLASITC